MNLRATNLFATTSRVPYGLGMETNMTTNQKFYVLNTIPTIDYIPPPVATSWRQKLILRAVAFLFMSLPGCAVGIDSDHHVKAAFVPEEALGVLDSPSETEDTNPRIRPLLDGRLYDTKRHEICKYVPAHDGVVRCMPVGDQRVSAYNYYADSACTVMAELIPHNQDVPDYVLHEQFQIATKSNTDVRLYEAVDITDVIYTKVGTVLPCTLTALGDQYDALVAGDEIPSTEFAAQ